MAIEISLRIFNPSPYSELSKQLGKEQFFTYCNDYYDLIMVNGGVSEDMIKIVKDTLKIQSEIDFTSNSKSPINYMIMDCSCELSFPVINEIILKNHGIQISPVKYENGWEYHKFVSITKKILSTILKELQDSFEVEVLAINEDDEYGPLRLHSLSTDLFLDRLTKAQISILLQVYDSGYYRIPRNVKLEEIANSLNITRYAAESRLRRGENRIMDLVLPFIDYEAKVILELEDKTA